jgi:hypothetical protein
MHNYWVYLNIGAAFLVTIVLCQLSKAKNRPPTAWHALLGAIIAIFFLIPIMFGSSLFESEFWSNAKLPGLLSLTLFMILSFIIGGVPAACVVAFYRRKIKR